MSKTNQQWGGRFNEPTDAFVARFTASVDFDQRMYRQDIQGSVAHAKMLTKVGVLTETERDAIIAGLQEVQGEIERGEFEWSVELEDVHMHIESALIARLGDVGVHGADHRPASVHHHRQTGRPAWRKSRAWRATFQPQIRPKHGRGDV